MDKRLIALALMALIAISTIITVAVAFAFPTFAPVFPTLHTLLADFFSEHTPQTGDPVGGGGFP